MIEFATVSREFRSLVVRRRELQTLLGSVFAGLGVFLQNAVQGQLPPSLLPIDRHLFATYATLLAVPCLILSLRMARLHGGMILNGILYARLLQDQDFTRRGDPGKAARHNFAGVSFVQFTLTDALAAFSTALLALALGASPAPAMALGLLVAAAWMGLYFRFHHQAATFAFRKIESEPCGPVTRDEWRGHVADSLEEANLGLLNDLSFAGLIVFSVFEVLSGLGKIAPGLDLAPAWVQRYGPIAYTVLMLVTCLTGLISFARVRIAIGHFSIQIDPTDDPFRPLHLTDSLLGYLLMAFLFATALHLLLIQMVPTLANRFETLLAIDAAAILLALLAEQSTLALNRRRTRRS